MGKGCGEGYKMNLKQFLEQNAQTAQEDQKEQEAQENKNELDTLAARVKADEYLSLKAQLARAIANREPAADILLMFTKGAFGENSEQFKGAREIIKKEKYPDGFEIALSNIRQQKRILKQQQKQQETQLKTLAEKITFANEEEKRLMNERTAAGTLKTGIVEMLDFYHDTEKEELNQGTIKRISELFEKHKNSPVEIGLLCGIVKNIINKQTAAGKLDLLQQQEIKDIQSQMMQII